MKAATKLYKTALGLALRDRRKDRPLIASLLKEATALRHPEATHALATWYLFGKGVPRNYRKGLELEIRAARQGVAEAAWNVAISYERGKGTKRNPAEALRYYKRAVRLGDDESLYEVGRCYFYGIGVRQNRRTAERWYSRARRAGVEEATTALGRRKIPLSRNRQ